MTENQITIEIYSNRRWEVIMVRKNQVQIAIKINFTHIIYIRSLSEELAISTKKIVLRMYIVTVQLIHT